MNNTELEDASNDDATIISELFSSAEAIQTSTDSPTNISVTKTPLQQNCDMSSTICGATKQNLIVSLQQNYDAESANFFNSTQFSGMENLNKMHIRHVHIPYILNGELYQIQTQDGENVTVKCCHCPPDRVYRGSVRSTGNFHMHIKRRHPDLLEKLHNMKVNALLERRDRLMRNRKISSNRNNRSRLNNFNGNLNDICSLKNEDNREHTSITSTTLDPVTESNMLHTHKLKIKTVFQRHQMQQREAEEMRNWNNAEYVVMPIGKMPADSESDQPINFSLKTQDNSKAIDTFTTSSSDSQEMRQLQEKRSPEDISTQNQHESIANLSNQSTNLSNINNEGNELMYKSHSNLLTSSISCPSAISSFSSSHQYEVESSRLYNCYSFQHENVSIIKPEQMLLGAESEAIDLTMQADSGIFSSSEDNDFQNNSNDSGINEARAASHKSTTDHITMADECVNNDVNNNNNISTVKWHELLMQVENSLRSIQREMNVRNQIESNRIFLDIAKFKFLNPGFQFNW